jgi:hypothetical protein
LVADGNRTDHEENEEEDEAQLTGKKTRFVKRLVFHEN